MWLLRCLLTLRGEARHFGSISSESTLSVAMLPGKPCVGTVSGAQNPILAAGARATPFMLQHAGHGVLNGVVGTPGGQCLGVRLRREVPRDGLHGGRGATALPTASPREACLVCVLILAFSHQRYTCSWFKYSDFLIGPSVPLL